jgi:GntR family histidine utilization transcriptional repressor
MVIRFNAETPRYVQVRQWIERQVATGYWKPGDTLPPERELAQQLGVSPLTVSRALQGLAREGIVTRKRRVGTVVAENLPPNPPATLVHCNAYWGWVGAHASLWTSTSAVSSAVY